MFTKSDPKGNKMSHQWETDMSTDLSAEEWGYVFSHIHKGSMNVSIQENGYKTCSRWYRTPVKLHKYYPEISPLCWRCNADPGSLLHIWWDCPLIQHFWREIHRLTTNITSYPLDSRLHSRNIFSTTLLSSNQRTESP